MKFLSKLFLAVLLLTVTSVSWAACPEGSKNNYKGECVYASGFIGLAGHPLAVERVFPNLDFWHLTNLEQPEDGSGRFFVTEQGGLIRVFPNRPDANQAPVYLDLSGQVSNKNSEEGLLGMAFDPKFKDNGFFYVYYSASNPRRSVVSRFSASIADPDLADLGSELVILEIPQPAGNHNGGQLAFGPYGYLYIGVGDGGWGGDPFGNGQNTGTLLGAILRIDISSASASESYKIPASNPFASIEGSRGEIFAYGLRNPWRFSFDMVHGETQHSDSEKYEPKGPVEIWVGDVGQNLWEEIDLVRIGLNYGWNVMEGSHCYFPNTNCLTSRLELPVHEYGREGGCSVTGGYVYRGNRLPSLTGTYVFGDFCSGKIWGMRYDGTSVTYNLLLADTGLNITSFGQDLEGEIYILSRNDGIYRLANPDEDN